MIDVNVKLEGKLGDLGYIVLGFEVAVKFRGYIDTSHFHFMNDYKPNSLDSLTRFQTRANEPLKLGYLRCQNSLTHDYFW